MHFNYYDLEKYYISKKISLIFPDWKEAKENIVVYSPHDDDAILGAGYILQAAIENNADCYVIIFCDGSGGYSKPKQKNKITEIRKNETQKAYKAFGIPKENIFRLNYPDFSTNTKIGWKLGSQEEGCISKVLPFLREANTTRILIPNGYKEHLDHEAVCKMGVYHAPQAGDQVFADWGEPVKIKTVLEYSVWGDFSPEDTLLSQRCNKIRANLAVETNNQIEMLIRKSIKEFKSQKQIIKDLVDKRELRKYQNNYIELYREIDPRPIISYQPYINLIKSIKFEKQK